MTRGLLTDEDVRRITRTMPLRKVATPDDVAAQVVVLASERLSGHVTGELVTVAGGMEGRVVHEEAVALQPRVLRADAGSSSWSGTDGNHFRGRGAESGRRWPPASFVRSSARRDGGKAVHGGTRSAAKRGRRHPLRSST